jgi:uncharacterized DUF497 family protein
MRIDRIIWDLDDDPDGNVQHFAANGVAVEEAEEVLFAADDVFASNSSGRPIVFGWTSTGKYLAVVFEFVEREPRSVYPLTAYETNP